jgi:hypothetical protein
MMFQIPAIMEKTPPVTGLQVLAGYLVGAPCIKVRISSHVMDCGRSHFLWFH